MSPTTSSPRSRENLSAVLADITKAKRFLDHVPQVDFADGLRRTVEFFRTTSG